MLIDQIQIKELNDYYALRGGRRTTGIHNFANCLGEASAKRTLAAGSGALRQEITEKVSSDRVSESRVREKQTDSTNNSCCDKCQENNQLLRMMTRNIYNQSLFGNSTVGSGALAAYQSMSKYLGTGFLTGLL